jgi:hypothetical protein
MTQAAKLKTTIRARASKTGESYTTARRQVLATRLRTATTAKEPEAPPLPNVPEVRDGRIPRGELSNRTAIKSTGHDLAHWFKVLDGFGKSHGHTRAAEHLYSEHKVSAWHAQMITITWERARGLRQENQSCTGTFQVSVSRALAAPVDWIVSFLNQAKTRKVWLKGADPALRKSIEEAFVAGKTMEMKKAGYARMRYKWLSSVVELRAYDKPGGRSSLVADTSELPDADAVAVRRESFGKALDRLRDLAAGGAAD